MNCLAKEADASHEKNATQRDSFVTPWTEWVGLPARTLAGLQAKFKLSSRNISAPCLPLFVASSMQGALMFNVGSDTSQNGAQSRSLLQNWPLAILFAGLGLNLAWIVGLTWLAVKLAVRLLGG
jgi:hypothetical protein